MLFVITGLLMRMPTCLAMNRDGPSTMVGRLLADQQEIVARGPRFSFADVVVTSVGLDDPRHRIERPRMPTARGPHRPKRFYPSQPWSPSRKPSREISKRIVAEGQSVRGVDSRPAGCCEWEQQSLLKHEEFSRAVPLGLFDYLRKSRAQRICGLAERG